MEKIHRLLTEYGDASFSCGEYSEDSSAEYEALADAANKAREGVIAEIEQLRDALRRIANRGTPVCREEHRIARDALREGE